MRLADITRPTVGQFLADSSYGGQLGPSLADPCGENKQLGQSMRARGRGRRTARNGGVLLVRLECAERKVRSAAALSLPRCRSIFKGRFAEKQQILVKIARFALQSTIPSRRLVVGLADRGRSENRPHRYPCSADGKPPDRTSLRKSATASVIVVWKGMTKPGTGKPSALAICMQ